ncbi:hypothetical protein GGU10DRAFT_337612 [Lentinula aff. detonsa]|uniref:Protein kinase domain-containing protein n=1 Tax=Lentinula aff. detonsa TaxID=2804958 RepID=A0AA38KSZ5_9AGAR|nr:hypothetical protein GGU10DRAFT_337612 [Lentinula aff. detonsa]
MKFMMWKAKLSILVLGSSTILALPQPQPPWLGKYIVHPSTLEDDGNMFGYLAEVKWVHKFQGIQQNDLVAKVFRSHTTTPDHVCAEIEALKQIGEFHVAGSYDGSMVIIMKKKPGEILQNTKQYKQAAPSDRSRLRSEAKKKYCEKVAKIAIDKKAYHDDKSSRNYLVQFDEMKAPVTISSIEVIDWGITRIVNEPVPEEKKVMSYESCLSVSIFHWENNELSMGGVNRPYMPDRYYIIEKINRKIVQSNLPFCTA